MKYLALALAALIATTAGAADPRASRYYEDALVRYEKKDLPGAIIQLKNALQIDATMLPVQMLLGKALLQNGEVAAAEVALLEALRLGVNRAEVVPLLGQAYLAQGKHKLLFEQQHFNLNGLPSAVQAQVLLLRAAAHADFGNTRDALQAVMDARAISPGNPETWLAEVPIRIRAQQFPQARVALDKAASLASDSVAVLYLGASLSHAEGGGAQALEGYTRVLKIAPAHTESLVARAGILIDLGRTADAALDLEALRKISPLDPRAAYLRALLAERAGRPGDALEALREVTTLIDPVPIDFIRYRPQLLMLNGLAHYGLGQVEKAKSYLENFQRVQNNTPASKLLAQIYLGESRSERAIEVLEVYLKTQPKDGQALVLLGSAYMAKGQEARALSYMKQALQTRDAPEFRTVLGLSMVRSGQAVNAIPELEAALKQNPGQDQAATALVSLYMRSGQAKKALALTETLVKRRPASADFNNLLGLVRRQAGKRAEARTAFEEAARLDDMLAAPRLNLARMDIEDKAFDSAAQRLNSLLRNNEKNAEAMAELAVLTERRGQIEEARRWLEKAVDSAHPKDTRLPLALSEFHLRHGHPPQAVEAARVAHSRAPEDIAVLMSMAKAQLASNDASSAKTTLSTATRIAEFNPVALVQIALLQLSAGHPAGAAYSLEKALSARPDFLPAQALMTEVELRLGEPAKAEKRAKAVLEKYPRRAIGHSLLGDVAQARGQSADALDAYRRAHQVEPTTETLLRLVRLLAGKDDKQALQLAEQWIKTHPKDLGVLRVLADGQARTGNFAAARRTYENILGLLPNDGASLNNLANILLRMKDPKAITVAEQAVSNSPGNAYALDTLGWILLQEGKLNEALPLLRDARLRAPENSEIRFHLAKALAKAGRISEARVELDYVLNTPGKTEWRMEAEKLMSELR